MAGRRFSPGAARGAARSSRHSQQRASVPVPAGVLPTPLGCLKKRAEFLFVRGGRSWRTDSMVLQARRRAKNDSHMARFGFTATKRLGSAVSRNRARRRLKETVRALAGKLANPGYDYVVIARQGALTRSFEELQEDLRKAFQGVHRERKKRA